jgi:hypothetical protein
MRWKNQTPSKARLKRDNYLFLQFFIAEKLGMTVAQLRSSMSTEELYAWSAYCQLKSEEEQKQADNARRQAQMRGVR